MPLLKYPLLALLALVVLTACGGETARTPATAQQSYGASVAASEARPAPAIAAEPDRYVGRRVTVDGRITRIAEDGCQLALDTTPALYVDAARSAEGCAWTVPAGADGVAIATGTLRRIGDSLRLSANGVQVTPVRVETTDL